MQCCNVAKTLVKREIMCVNLCGSQFSVAVLHVSNSTNLEDLPSVYIEAVGFYRKKL